jgi:glycosyltransferase involved in cell wall biosynthesis
VTGSPPAAPEGPLRVLLVHERYLQRGGEDTAFEGERDLLRAAGHEVTEYLADNRDVAGMGRLDLALTTVWSRRACGALADLVGRVRPHVAHFHNTLPLISPAAYQAVRRCGVPVVQTLHNYRLICPGGLLLRGGAPCEACVGAAVPLPGVFHACYRESRAASGVVALMLATHRALRTWTRQVDVYVALTRFARERFVAGGLPAGKLVVKPNSVPDPGPPSGAPRDGVLFVGRMSAEKGADLVLDAWERLPRPGRLTLIGDGPAAPALRSRAERLGARWLGPLAREAVQAEMKRAATLVLPSRLYEGGLPLVVIEAFAASLPVLALRLGAMAELVEDGRTGWLVRPGDPVALASALQEALDHPALALERGARAREVYRREHTPEVNLRRLLAVYRRAGETFAVGGLAPR